MPNFQPRHPFDQKSRLQPGCLQSNKTAVHASKSRVDPSNIRSNNMRIIVLALLAALPAFAQKRPDRIAPACGPNSVSFSAREGAPQPLVQPDPAKAYVYFIQDKGPDGDSQHYTIKIGLDGAWVGAYKDNSYFTVPVQPGVHHICANVQSSFIPGLTVALAHFTAQPGQVYYFRTRFLLGKSYPFLELDRPDSDQAAYLIDSYPYSLWRAKK
jgi:hypothetical protein